MVNLPDSLKNVKELIKRFQKAKENWELWRALHQDAMDYSIPMRSTFRTQVQGQEKNLHIYDSTAEDSLHKFVSRIQSSLVPPWRKWMELTPGMLVPEDQKKEIEEELQEHTNEFFDNLNHSNFSTEIASSFADLAIGTGAIMIEEGRFNVDEKFNFTNIPLAELYLEDVKNAWRHHELPVCKIKERWPEAKLTQSLEEAIRNDPLKKVKIINGMLYDNKSRRYYHILLYEKDESILFMQSFRHRRLIVFRWSVTPGEVYGRGPIMQVLGDIKSLNKVQELLLQNAAIQMCGLYTGISDGVFNPHTVRISPGAIISVGQNGTQNPSLQALPRAGDLGLGAFVLESLQNKIKKALFVDQLGEITDPVRSATEIMIRKQEMLELAGASIGRLKTELIEPLVAACIEIMEPNPEEPYIEIDGKQTTIKQTSPLAKAEELEDFQNSQVWFDSVSQLGRVVGPQVIMGSVKIEDLPSFWAEKLSVPMKLVRDEEERQPLADAAMDIAVQQMGAGIGQQQPV
jgi:hypothetical protein